MNIEKIIPPSKHIPQLDGLRGIAILFVLCFHYLPTSLATRFGWSGVDLFFVLSGYLITSRLLPYLNDKKILRKFYWNRFIRIVPLYYAFLLLFFGIWFLFNSTNTLNTFPFYTKNWQHFFVFIQNWIFITDETATKIHLLHLWSVAIEEQIYLIFPVLLLLTKRSAKSIFLTLVILFFFVLCCRYFYYTHFNSTTVYVKIFWNSFFRFDSFLAGAIVYLVYNKIQVIKNYSKILSWLGIICFLTISLKIVTTKNAEITNSFIATIGYSLIAIMYASLLNFILCKKNKYLDKIILNKFLRFTGKISYGIYLFHWPMYITMFALLNKLNLTVTATTINYINILCCIPLTYLLSYLSFRYFESFFLKWKAKLDYTESFTPSNS